MAAHLEKEHRHRQHQPDPEPVGHVDQLSVRAGLCCDRHRFQRHPADRARARPGLADLRVHRTGVLRDLLGAGVAGAHRAGSASAGRGGTGGGTLRVNARVPKRVSAERIQTPLRTKVVRDAVLLDSQRPVPVHAHPADRIDRGGLLDGSRCVRVGLHGSRVLLPPRGIQGEGDARRRGVRAARSERRIRGDHGLEGGRHDDGNSIAHDIAERVVPLHRDVV